jgi:penicillin-binding protein 1A
VAQQIGMSKVVERARALGLEGELPPVLAISLGAGVLTPLNLTQAYTAFANRGLISTSRLITEVRDRDGKVLYSQEPRAREAISPQNAYIMASLLKEVVNAGTAARALALRRPVAGKTGTSNDEMDAWFVGLTPHLVTGVFVGFDKLKTLGRLETGGSAALPIFVEYGKKVLSAYPPDDFAAPRGIVMTKVHAKTGLLVEGGEPGLVLPFMAGTEPVRSSANSAAGMKSGEDLLKQLY